jgi:hypothetical protein
MPVPSSENAGPRFLSGARFGVTFFRHHRTNSACSSILCSTASSRSGQSFTCWAKLIIASALASFPLKLLPKIPLAAHTDIADLTLAPSNHLFSCRAGTFVEVAIAGAGNEPREPGFCDRKHDRARYLDVSVDLGAGHPPDVRSSVSRGCGQHRGDAHKQAHTERPGPNLSPATSSRA